VLRHLRARSFDFAWQPRRQRLVRQPPLASIHVRPRRFRLFRSSLGPERGRLRDLRALPRSTPPPLDLSPDGRLVSFAVGRGRFGYALGVLDLRNGRRRILARGAAPRFWPPLGRFSLDGRLLAVGDTRGRAEVWSTATWRPITRSFAGQTGALQLAAISPDDRTLATGADDGTLRLWDIKTQQPLGTPLPGRLGGYVIPLFTPDGSALIAVYDSGRAYRWDIRTASLIRHACRVAGRRLTRAEWEQFLPSRDYDPAC
jgi:hypothetical protein